MHGVLANIIEVPDELENSNRNVLREQAYKTL